MTESVPSADTRKRSLGIVVGYDGSENADSALDWAIAEAKRTGEYIHVVSAYTLPSYGTVGMDSTIVPEEDTARQGALETAQSGRDRAIAAGVEADAQAGFGDAAGVLRDLSTDADLLVLGARGRGGFLGMLIGSTASSVPGHAHCPSIVVPHVSSTVRPADQRENVVIVGMDGSERGRIAALTAAERAQALGVPLRLICALPPVNGTVAWLPPADAVEAVKGDLQVQLDAGREWLLSYFPDLTIETSLLDGTAAQVLTELSEGALLTVVGARGGGGFLGMLLGSTSQAVLSQARGPIMVVPETGDDPRLETRANFGPGHIPTL